MEMLQKRGDDKKTNSWFCQAKRCQW